MIAGRPTLKLGKREGFRRLAGGRCYLVAASRVARSASLPRWGTCSCASCRTRNSPFSGMRVGTIHAAATPAVPAIPRLTSVGAGCQGAFAPVAAGPSLAAVLRAQYPAHGNPDDLAGVAAGSPRAPGATPASARSSEHLVVPGENAPQILLTENTPWQRISTFPWICSAQPADDPSSGMRTSENSYTDQTPPVPPESVAGVCNDPWCPSPKSVPQPWISTLPPCPPSVVVATGPVPPFEVTARNDKSKPGKPCADKGWGLNIQHSDIRAAMRGMLRRGADAPASPAFPETRGRRGRGPHRIVRKRGCQRHLHFRMLGRGLPIGKSVRLGDSCFLFMFGVLLSGRFRASILTACAGGR